ncbi:MAG: succinylglutamate desuccinylase/aspartoacylase family protein [Sphingobacteriia bacterium]|nr:succinylglutamate desuccinylase/aspartoacylase family protein [Sphingobacteriia bacterium]
MKKRIVFLLFFASSLTTYSQSISKNVFVSDQNGDNLTNYNEMMNYLSTICKKGSVLHLDTLAFSVKGRAIPLIHVKTDDKSIKNKINVLLFAQQHGDEPSGKEALLQLIQEIADDKLDSYLDYMNLLIVPMVNPDGAEAGTRRNGRGVDLNRNHLILTEPETQGLHKLFNKYLPEVTLDMHEYYPYEDTTKKFPYIRQFDEQVGILTNLNVNSDLREMQKRELLTYIGQEVSAKGFLFGEYAVGSIANGKTIRHSTVDIDDGRQSFGIQSTISLISEGLNGKTPTDRIQKRSLAQLIVAKSLLKWCLESPDWIKRRIAFQRHQLINGTDSIIIQMDHVSDGSQRIVPMHNVITGKDSVFHLSNFAPKVAAIKKVKRPLAYLVPITDTALMRFLNAQQISYVKLDQLHNGKIFEYNITEPKQIILEGMTIWDPTFSYSPINREIDLNQYYFVPTNQLRVITICLAFEPNSMFGLANYSLYNYLIKKGSYPILRVE